MIAPSLVWTTPFALLLLAIAILPVMRQTEHWWHCNRNKFLVSATLGLATLAYYFLRPVGFPHGDHHLDPGMPTLLAVIDHAVVKDYIPFMVMLLSLFTIAGGIRIQVNLPPTPLTNVSILATGGLIASLVGTTGASMLLIRPLLDVNRQRKQMVHSVVFFIFIVSNIGGSLLPIGDPPLFLGYLRGVPFLWTLVLVKEWAVCLAFLLVVFYLWDTRLWRRDPLRGENHPPRNGARVQVEGKPNFVLLCLAVLCIALLVPGKKLGSTSLSVPDLPLVGVREYAQILLTGLAWWVTSASIREANRFSFFPILEVAALFIGLFVTMQVPIEILNLRGGELGLTSPAQYFWVTGLLSSFLDNAPTYVVFFQTAGATPWATPDQLLHGVATATQAIPESLLVAISCGAVFMGANTYIGNAPNFMVKSIAEQDGVRMPSFFHYILYSVGILVPLFILVTLLFFR